MNRYDRPLIAQYVDKWANKRSDSEALVFGDQRLTWAQVACQVDAIAKAMLEAGVRKGDRVAFLAMARNEFLTSFMAAARVGAVWVGISPKSTTEEVLYVLQDCQPSVLISLREYGGKDFADTLSLAGVRETLANIPHVWAIGEPTKEAEDFHELVSRPREHLDNALRTRAADVRPQEPVLLIYTSGSTGKPKGVLHTHESILASVAVQADKFRFHENGR